MNSQFRKHYEVIPYELSTILNTSNFVNKVDISHSEPNQVGLSERVLVSYKWSRNNYIKKLTVKTEANKKNDNGFLFFLFLYLSYRSFMEYLDKIEPANEADFDFGPDFEPADGFGMEFDAVCAFREFQAEDLKEVILYGFLLLPLFL